MKELSMRKAFKIFNILILVYYGILGVVTVMKAFGAGAELEEYASGLGAFAAIALVVALVPILLVIFMAREGLRENYDLCSKIALVVVVLDIIGLLMSEEKSAGAVFAVILGIIYVFMAKTAD